MQATDEISGPERRFALPGGVYNRTPPRIVFGWGSAESLAEEVARLGARRALVLSTPGRAGLAERLLQRLGGLGVGLLDEAVSQVPIELARRGRSRARELEADCLVSVGGGASIGLGKGIALELPLPIVAVPTTYAGSEMTGFCGITIEGVKRMHASLNMLASTVIYDPSLTLALPAEVGAASAMNALAHCLDGACVATAAPVHRLAALAAAPIIARSARALRADPGDLAARSDLLYAAHLAGASLTGGFALQHGLAHTLGGSFGIAHGLAHALVLPHVAAYDCRLAGAPLAALARAMGVDDLGGAIFDLLVDLELPTRLAELGVAERDLEAVVGITLETDNGTNPAPVTAEAVRAIVADAYHGRRPDNRPGGGGSGSDR